MQKHPGILRDSAIRVWRHRRILWWMFVVNVVLAGFATVPVSLSMGQVANHSLHSDRLVDEFDLPAFLELAGNPEVHLWSNAPESILFALAFFLLVLFLNGGILETYRVDRKLTAGEFFQACGAFFWRWVRLLALMLLALVPVALLAGSVRQWAGVLARDAPQEKLGFWVGVSALFTVTLLMMAVRLWFDMAQVVTVSESERSVVRSVATGWWLTLRNFGSLFWIYLRISSLSWIGLAAGIWIWSRTSPASTATHFAVWELILLWWTATRLWQRASETAWYQRRRAGLEQTPALLQEPAPLFREVPSV